jgi:transcriptional regulator NrdR family protein
MKADYYTGESRTFEGHKVPRCTYCGYSEPHYMWQRRGDDGRSIRITWTCLEYGSDFETVDPAS